MLLLLSITYVYAQAQTENSTNSTKTTPNLSLCKDDPGAICGPNQNFTVTPLCTYDPVIVCWNDH